MAGYSGASQALHVCENTLAGPNNNLKLQERREDNGAIREERPTTL